MNFWSLTLAFCLLISGVLHSQTDQITLVNGPDPVEAGKSAVVNISYTATAQRKIQVVFQRNSSPWTSYGSASVLVEAGSGTIGVSVPISSSTPIAANFYKHGAFITTTTGGYAERFSESAQGNIDCIPFQYDNLITKTIAPELVIAGDEVHLDVSYEASTSRDILVHFRSTANATNILGSARYRVAEGRGRANLTVPISAATPVAIDAYQFDIGLVPVDDSMSGALAQDTAANVDCLESPYRDDILSVFAPNQVVPNTTIPVSIRYHSKVARDLFVEIRSNTTPFTSYGSQRISLEKGHGAVAVQLPVNGDLQIQNDACEIVASLITKNGATSPTFDISVQKNIDGVAAISMTTIEPAEYPYGLRNPLKGFRPDAFSNASSHPYATVARHYIRWNQIENDESDTVQKIIDHCNTAWANFENAGIKVIPRVYLDWDSNVGNEYWPADMVTGDYTSEQFKQRLERLILRLGEAWDNDPRVAWVQMGIIGYWGEHHSPSPTAEIQALMGDAFTRAFKNKRFLVRHATEFLDHEVGYYWDSWAHISQTNSHGADIETINNQKARWETQMIEGEVAYNWGNWQIQPGDDPDDTLSDPIHREYLIDTIRNLHCTGLGWIANYDKTDPLAQAGASEVQKAFGYRYVINEFSCPTRVEPGENLRVKFKVTNTGSAPFYEKWPLQVCLLNPVTKEVFFQHLLEEIDIRTWMPGDNWDEENNVYLTPAIENLVDVAIPLPSAANLPPGEYLTAIAILDPSSMQPAVRFATNQYIAGNRHPMVLLGIGADLAGTAIVSPTEFTDPMTAPRTGYPVEPLNGKLRWRKQHFSETQISGGLADDYQDVDGDLIPNILEFALGTDPKTFSPQPTKVKKNGDDYTFEFIRPSGLDGISYQVQFSDSLKSDEWRNADATIIQTDGEMEWVEAKESQSTGADATKRFGRLRVVPDP